MATPEEIQTILPDNVCNLVVPITDEAEITWRHLPGTTREAVIRTLVSLVEFCRKDAFFKVFTPEQVQEIVPQIASLAQAVFADCSDYRTIPQGSWQAALQRAGERQQGLFVGSRIWQEHVSLAQKIRELAAGLIRVQFPQIKDRLPNLSEIIYWQFLPHAAKIAGQAAALPIYPPAPTPITIPHTPLLAILGLGMAEVRMGSLNGTERLICHGLMLNRGNPVLGCSAIGPEGQGDQGLTYFHPLGTDCNQRTPL